MSPKRARAIRIGIMLLAIVGLGAFGYLTRPNRDLGTAAFSDSIPLESAQMVDGAFSGVIAWEAWADLPAAEQRRRAETFEGRLKERGLFRDFQLRGPDDQVLAVPVEGAFRASPKLYSDFGEPDGVPAEAPVDPPADGSAAQPPPASDNTGSPD